MSGGVQRIGGADGKTEILVTGGETQNEDTEADPVADLAADSETDPEAEEDAAGNTRPSVIMQTQPSTEPETEAEPREATLVFAGDILFDEHYAVMSAMVQRGQGIAGGVSEGLLSEMRAADLCVINNEFPYTDRGTPTAGKQFTFRAKPKYASWLLDMGADLVTLANNHASDYGEISLTDTLDTLDALGLPHAGSGRNLEEASAPVYLEAGGFTIAFLSATQIERMGNPSTPGATEDTPGVFRCLKPELLLTRIAEAKEKADYVIACVHWGTESTDQIDHYQAELAPKLAEAGADVVIGCHPHVLQPIGYCDDVPVVYSLGNFIFNSKTLNSGLVKVTLRDDEPVKLQFIPAKQTGCRVRESEGSEKGEILRYMQSISPEVVFDADGYVTKKE